MARQFLTESPLLSVLGAAAALLLSQWSVEYLYRFEIPPVIDLSLDWSIFLFALTVALLRNSLATDDSSVAPSTPEERDSVRTE